jgi:hypothetical protein
MNFAETAVLLLNASQPVVWVRTHEASEAKKELVKELEKKATVYRWSILQGLMTPGNSEIKMAQDDGLGDVSMAGSAAGLIASVAAFKQKMGESEHDTDQFALVVDNFHQFIANPQELYPIIQALQDFSACQRSRACSILLICHYDHKVLPDLRSYCSIIDHDLPGATELQEITHRVVTTVEGSLTKYLNYLDSNHMLKLAQAGLGLSRLQYESELSFSLTCTAKEISSNKEVKWDEVLLTERVIQGVQDRKAALFNAEGIVRLHRSVDKMTDIGGFAGLKKMILSRFARQDIRYRKDRYPRGLILLGSPGTGKSSFARAVGDSLGVITATVDIGSLKEGIVGATEGKVRRLFQILNAMGRIVVFIDEIEKAFPTGNELDSGVSADMLSVWLTNLSDPTRQYYVIAAANNVKKLPDALLRPGRFDNIVMVDLPNPAQQKLIWDICMKRFGLEDQPIPPHERWSGTEIDTCCENADSYGISLIEAAKKIVPTAVLSPEAVTAVREYAHNRAIDAETGEIYRKPGSFQEPVITAPASAVKRTRKIVTSDESNN